MKIYFEKNTASITPHTLTQLGPHNSPTGHIIGYHVNQLDKSELI
jgi:hypothetical protein